RVRLDDQAVSWLRHHPMVVVGLRQCHFRRLDGSWIRWRARGWSSRFRMVRRRRRSGLDLGQYACWSTVRATVVGPDWNRRRRLGSRWLRSRRRRHRPRWLDGAGLRPLRLWSRNRLGHRVADRIVRLLGNRFWRLRLAVLVWRLR